MTMPLPPDHGGRVRLKTGLSAVWRDHLDRVTTRLARAAVCQVAA
jgi:hypothetical protein